MIEIVDLLEIPLPIVEDYLSLYSKKTIPNSGLSIFKINLKAFFLLSASRGFL